MPFCSKCGAKLDEAARFCPACGEPQAAGGGVETATYLPTGETAQAPRGSLPTVRSDIAGAVITILGGGLLLLSAFLPWMSARVIFATLSRNAFQLGNQLGFSADGLVLVLLGLVALLIGITRSVRASLPAFIQRSPIIVGIAAGLVPLLRVGSINSLAHQVSASSGLASASVGFGLWLAIFAALITIVGGLVLRSQRLAPIASPAVSLAATSRSSSSRRDERQLFDVVVTALESDPGVIARIVTDHAGGSRESILALLVTLPATVLHGVGFASAEGVRREIAAKGANQVTVVPLASEPAHTGSGVKRPAATVMLAASDAAAWAQAADPSAHSSGPAES